MRFQFIQYNRSAFPVNKRCQTEPASIPERLLSLGKFPGIEKKSRKPQASFTAKRDISSAHCMAGSPMITADLNDEPELSSVSRPRVARMMRDMGIQCKTIRKFVVSADSKHSEPVARIC